MFSLNTPLAGRSNFIICLPELVKLDSDLCLNFEQLLLGISVFGVHPILVWNLMYNVWTTITKMIKKSINASHNTFLQKLLTMKLTQWTGFEYPTFMAFHQHSLYYSQPILLLKAISQDLSPPRLFLFWILLELWIWYFLVTGLVEPDYFLQVKPVGELLPLPQWPLPLLSGKGD